MAANYGDLSEHTSTLVALLGLFAGLTAFFFWKFFREKFNQNTSQLSVVEKKLDQWLTIHEACKARQEEERKEVLQKIETGIKEIETERRTDWKTYFWPHVHDEKGDVKIPRVLLKGQDIPPK